MTTSEIKQQADKVIKLSETSNILRAFATAEIELKGYYTFERDGQKIFVEK